MRSRARRRNAAHLTGSRLPPSRACSAPAASARPRAASRLSADADPGENKDDPPARGEPSSLAAALRASGASWAFARPCQAASSARSPLSARANRRHRRGRSPPTRSRPPNPPRRGRPTRRRTGAYAARDATGDATARCPSPSAPFAPSRRPAGWDPAPVRPAARGGGRRAPADARGVGAGERVARVRMGRRSRSLFPPVVFSPAAARLSTLGSLYPSVPNAGSYGPSGDAACTPRFSPSRSSPTGPRACATASVARGSRRPRWTRARPASSGAGSRPAATTPRLTGTAWSARTRDARAPPPSRRARAATRPRCPVRSGTRSSSPRRLCRARSPQRLARFLRDFRLRRPPPDYPLRPNHRSRVARR